MKQATTKYRTELKTTNPDRIKQVVKLGIVREVTGIQARNEARKYALSRAKSNDSFHSDQGRLGDH